MALKRPKSIVGPGCPSECSTVPSPTLTDTMFETLFANDDDDVETSPPKTNKSKLEVMCAELDISPVALIPKTLNSAEDVRDSMSSWDAWLEKVNKKHDAAEEDRTDQLLDRRCQP